MKKWEKNLQKKIANHYKQTYWQMEKSFSQKCNLLSAKDLELARKLNEGKITQKEYNTWRIKAEKDLHKEVRGLAESLTKADEYATQETNKVIPHAYAEGMNKQLYEIERYGVDLKGQFDIVNDDAVARASRGFFRKIDPAKDTAFNVRRIRSAITAGILSGQSVKDVAKVLLPVMRYNSKHAEMMARTWINSAENGGHFDQAVKIDRSGVRMKKMWLSAGDDRVRDSHRELDEEERYIEEPFSNGGQYPCDPSLPPEEYYNCRCTELRFPEGYPPDLSNRIMGTDKDYEEWKKGRHGSEQPSQEQTNQRK